MRGLSVRVFLTWFTLALGFSAAQPVSLSGTWKLDVDQSKWGKKRKPNSVTLRIEHDEPAIKYTGMVIDALGEDRTFAFEGTVDGKEVLINGLYGAGTLMVRRRDARTIVSEFRSSDGKLVESTTTRLQRDGRRLTQRVRLSGPEGTLDWTEVYRKQ